ncbi:uncharacterized protein LOC100572916 isoform X2 [Acyrthosiphon pisum]|uniref:Uncharacterized protein n=1 Tax=Acyrthosiphon pisum TaxID=7029 RepID=A0A8R2JQU8_ACYPI|nr:uncharacterized protein LOC100572916 isoform X2 [Acyrthosiphon pisum]
MKNISSKPYRKTFNLIYPFIDQLIAIHQQYIQNDHQILNDLLNDGLRLAFFKNNFSNKFVQLSVGELRPILDTLFLHIDANNASTYCEAFSALPRY